MGAQKTPIQKKYEIQTGSDSLNVEFLGSNRQFNWIEISIVPDKSDKHTTIYDSYNREMAVQLTKSLQLSPFTEIYSLENEKKYSIDNLTQKHLLYKQFVTWNCNGSSVAPLTEYVDNPIFQEFPDEQTCYSLKSDERIYFDLRASSGYVREAEKLERNDSKINLQITLKAAASFNLRVRIWAYWLSEYLYVLSKSGLTLKHRTYAINQNDDDFLEWVGEICQFEKESGIYEVNIKEQQKEKAKGRRNSLWTKTNSHLEKKSKSKSSKSAKWQIFHVEMEKNKQKTAPDKYKGKKTENNRSLKKQ